MVFNMKEDGFTLIEVLVAFTLLLMTSQILLFGMAFAAKTETRAQEIEYARRNIGMHLAEDTDCITGELYLEFADEDGPSAMAKCYQGTAFQDLGLNVNIVWIDEEIMPDPEDWEEDREEEQKE